MLGKYSKFLYSTLHFILGFYTKQLIRCLNMQMSLDLFFNITIQCLQSKESYKSFCALKRPPRSRSGSQTLR